MFAGIAEFERELIHDRTQSGRIGKAKAITATARKIAVLFYNTLRYGRRYAARHLIVRRALP